MAIGKKLEESYYRNVKIVNYSNLLKLTRIKWQQTGNIPPETRRQLLIQLESRPLVMEVIHQAIIEILQQAADVPKESFAYKEKESFFSFSKEEIKKIKVWNVNICKCCFYIWGLITSIIFSDYLINLPLVTYENHVHTISIFVILLFFILLAKLEGSTTEKISKDLYNFTKTKAMSRKK